jgi:anti-anti-sigma regulatory factor
MSNSSEKAGDFRAVRDEGSGPLQISGTLDIYSAEKLRDALASHVECEAEPAIDLSRAENCSLVALQLLCSATRTALAIGKKIVVVTASDAVVGSCRSAGIALEDLGISQGEL